ncbi:MAG: hypothetical protein ACE5DX_01195 [Candidatus Dojkabacteria bacterium]
MPNCPTGVYFLDPEMEPAELFSIANSMQVLLQGRDPGNSAMFAMRAATDAEIIRTTIGTTSNRATGRPLDSLTNINASSFQFGEGWIDKGKRRLSYVLALSNISIA